MTVKDTTKKRWRFEIITPVSKGKWNAIQELDDDEKQKVEDDLRFLIQKPGIWEFRIVPNE